MSEVEAGAKGSGAEIDSPRKNRILIVDDDPNILALLGDALQHAKDLPNETVLAVEPKIAHERLAREKFDLVLSDYKMPDQDGIELLLEVKAAQPHALRMLMTAHSTLRMALAAVMTAEVHSYIEKPFDPADVVATIREALWRRDPFMEGRVAVADSSEHALRLVDDLRSTVSKSHSPSTDVALTLSFGSPIDFNRFTFRLFQDHLADVRDVHFQEGKFVISVAVRPTDRPVVR